MKPEIGRVLDLDIENRPLSYWYDGNCTSDITAIAWGWLDEPKIHVRALGQCTQAEMLIDFVTAYDEADMVTGHYLRKHDLPIVNGALIEHGMATLSAKLVSDTKLDLVKRGGISASQDNLAGILGLPQPKRHMSQTEWREANRLTDDGVYLTIDRVRGDIKQHKALRAELVRRGLLGPPKMWRP